MSTVSGRHASVLVRMDSFSHLKVLRLFKVLVAKTGALLRKKTVSVWKNTLMCSQGKDELWAHGVGRSERSGSWLNLSLLSRIACDSDSARGRGKGETRCLGTMLHLKLGESWIFSELKFLALNLISLHFCSRAPKTCRTCWQMPGIPANWEAKAGPWKVWGHLGNLVRSIVKY